MNRSEVLTLLNDTGREELIELPGIGPVLAERIIAARPYDSPEAATAVKGVGSNLLERWMAADMKAPVPGPVSEVTPERQEEPSAPETIAGVFPAPETATDERAARSPLGRVQDAIVGGGQAVAGGFAGLRDRFRQRAVLVVTEAPPERTRPAPQSPRSPRSLIAIVVGCIITGVVAILLTLAVLGGINGSLSFATTSNLHAVEAENSVLTAQVATFRQDLDGLRARVDVLEGLADRVVVVEKSQQQQSVNLESIGQQVGAMQTKVTALDTKVTAQEGRTQRFETFLKDLQTLLGGLFTEGAAE